MSPPSFLIIQGLTKPTVRILDVSSKPGSLGLFEVLPCVIFIFLLYGAMAIIRCQERTHSSKRLKVNLHHPCQS